MTGLAYSSIFGFDRFLDFRALTYIAIWLAPSMDDVTQGWFDRLHIPVCCSFDFSCSPPPPRRVMISTTKPQWVQGQMVQPLHHVISRAVIERFLRPK